MHKLLQNLKCIQLVYLVYYFRELVISNIFVTGDIFHTIDQFDTIPSFHIRDERNFDFQFEKKKRQKYLQ